MMRLILVGCGGTGSWLFPGLYRLARDKDVPIVLIDRDRVEAHNCGRQAFLPSDVGEYKCRALTNQVKDLHTIEAVTKYVGPDDADLFRDGDIILCCPDNHVCRAAVLGVAKALNNVALLLVGNEKTDGSITPYVRRDGYDCTPCPTVRHPEFIDPKDGDRSTMSCGALAALPGGEQTMLANIWAASVALAVTAKILSGENAPLPVDLYFDTARLAVVAQHLKGE